VRSTKRTAADGLLEEGEDPVTGKPLFRKKRNYLKEEGKLQMQDRRDPGERKGKALRSGKGTSKGKECLKTRNRTKGVRRQKQHLAGFEGLLKEKFSCSRKETACEEQNDKRGVAKGVSEEDW